MRYIAHWYNETEVVTTDKKPIVAATKEEAEKEAYRRYNGNPPAKLLWLEELED